VTIAALRIGALAVNAAFAGGVALLVGLAWPWALLSIACFFVSYRWLCGLAPHGESASPELVAIAVDLARRMGAGPPRHVRTMPGMTAAAVRVGWGGYGLLIGAEVLPRHAEAMLAHEIAHARTGDLFWEPFTDGPARVTLPLARSAVPLWLVVFPFFLLGAPLARLSELEADRLAAVHVPSYPLVLKELTAGSAGRVSLLYPSSAQRLRHAARDSIAIS